MTVKMKIAGHKVESIGEVAGIVWKYLNQNGAVTLSKLARDIGVPRDLAMQGLGWLAREGKIAFTMRARSKLVSLR